MSKATIRRLLKNAVILGPTLQNWKEKSKIFCTSIRSQEWRRLKVEKGRCSLFLQFGKNPLAIEAAEGEEEKGSSSIFCLVAMDKFFLVLSQEPIGPWSKV